VGFSQTHTQTHNHLGEIGYTGKVVVLGTVKVEGNYLCECSLLAGKKQTKDVGVAIVRIQQSRFKNKKGLKNR
jgi:hypothetical protein